MKLLFSAVLASCAATALGVVNNPVTNPGIYQNENQLESAWNMDEPEVDYTTTNNTFHLTYNTTTFFSDFDSDTHLNEEFYDVGCKTGDSAEKVVTTGIKGINMYSSQMEQDAGGILHLDFQLEPAILTKDTALYTDYGNGTGTLDLCIRAAIGFNGTANSNLTLQQQIDGGYREVNFIESLLTVVYDLQNDFEILSLNVEPKDKVTTTFAEDAYGIEAWLCNITTPTSDYSTYTYTPTGLAEVTRSYPPAIDDTAFYFNQGALISVCVRPVDDAYSEGIIMDEITNFTWTRTSGPLPVSQKAVDSASAADNLLTYYPGCTGDHFCRFSSILFADFYITRGTASGSGSAKTKFEGTRRRLGANNEGRALQETAGSVFDVSVELDITDEGPGALKTAGGVSLGFTALASFMALAGSMLFF